MTPFTIPMTDLITIVSTVARDSFAPQRAAKRTSGTFGLTVHMPFGADDHVYRHNPLGVAA